MSTSPSPKTPPASKNPSLLSEHPAPQQDYLCENGSSFPEYKLDKTQLAELRNGKSVVYLGMGRSVLFIAILESDLAKVPKESPRHPALLLTPDTLESSFLDVKRDDLHIKILPTAIDPLSGVINALVVRWGLKYMLNSAPLFCPIITTADGQKIRSSAEIVSLPYLIYCHCRAQKNFYLTPSVAETFGIEYFQDSRLRDYGIVSGQQDIRQRLHLQTCYLMKLFRCCLRFEASELANFFPVAASERILSLSKQRFELLKECFFQFTDIHDVDESDDAIDYFELKFQEFTTDGEAYVSWEETRLSF